MLRGDMLEWVVLGMGKDKINYLFKSLLKSLRRALSVGRCLRALPSAGWLFGPPLAD